MQRLMVVSLLIAYGSHAYAGGAAPTAETAQAAYDAKQWASCAAQWQAVAQKATGDRQRLALYNAACCYALDGKRAPAFATLETLIAAGDHDGDALEHDSDLADLRRDARWTPMMRELRARTAAWEKSLKAPALRRQLLAMTDEDQAARNAWMAKKQRTPEWRALALETEEVDKKNTAALRQAVRTWGWPGKDLVGEDGAQAAWLVQHADLDLAFKKQALALMEPLVARGQVTAKQYAYLYDRVAVFEHRKQRYGTQFDGSTSEPFPIEDPAHVDERRRAAGMPSLAEYRKEFQTPVQK